ncbi:MAG TPA: hypothetical protein VLE43_04140 [Candidatus Saccharimonadia bacterium]|nr:hypothetical protein [Candidatus Saccharimonadia bacterium]
MPLPSVPSSLIKEAIVLLGTEDLDDATLESRMLESAGDDMLARRLIDWIPEAFGYVAISHVGKVTILNEFQAKNAKGKWRTLPMKAEPIFAPALLEAQEMFHDGPRDVHLRIAMRSACLNSINNALNGGAKIDGATISGPALIGIPAEVYLGEERSFWSKLWGRK